MRTDAEITACLCQMEVEDQAGGRTPDTIDVDADVARARELNQIIKQVGWPTEPRFGEFAVRAAWLIAQHCVMGLHPSNRQTVDLSFQKYVMRLMRPLRRAKQIPAWHYAYLLDRTRTMEGKLQPYGTQYKPMGEGKPAQLTNVWRRDSLDHRRAAIGLPPAPPTLS